MTVLTSIAQNEDKSIFVGNVISDTTTLINNTRTTLTSILKSQNKIEIRLTTSTTFEFTNYIILTYNKRWTAKYYYYEPSQDKVLSKEINKKVNLDTIFSKLVENNIFSLPDQDSVKTEKLSFHPETNEFSGAGMSVCQGTCYWIDFKVGDKFRTYNYCNPKDYADFYPLVQELRSFTNIVDIMGELTKE